jgi:hypothetical protein
MLCYAMLCYALVCYALRCFTVAAHAGTLEPSVLLCDVERLSCRIHPSTTARPPSSLAVVGIN